MSTTIFISDLSPGLSENELVEAIRPFASVIRLSMSKQMDIPVPSCSAYVEFNSHADAERAFLALNETPIKGFVCTIEWSTRKVSLSPPREVAVPTKATAPPVPPPPPPRPSVAPKAAPPLPPKMAGKAPPPVPQAKPSVGGKAPPTIGKSASSSPPSEKAPAAPLSELINIHWKPASAHPAGGKRVSLGPAENDQFLRPFIPSASQPRIDPLSGDNPIPGVLALGDGTIFTAHLANLPDPSIEPIKQYFAKKHNTKFDSVLNHSNMSTVREDGGGNGGKKSALDKERIKLIGLALGGTITSRSNRRGIFRQYREATTRCDYAVVTTDIMCPLLQLLKNVTDEELQMVLEYVRSEVNASSLPEAVVMDEFEEPDVFLYEMSKVPEVKVRLECMIFEQTFEDLFQLTVNSLNVIYLGLEVIAHNLPRLTKLFQLILKTGNILNEGSKIGSHQSSFCLATLAKLNEVKSSVDPKIDILHFILSHCSPEEALLFSDDDIVKLKNASNLRCYRVRDEVKDLLDSITAVNEILKNPIPSAGPEDQFNAKMASFSKRIYGADQWLSKYAFNVFASYKNLSTYFEDTKAVYPPPKEKTTEQFDIIELFAWFGAVARTHEKEIKKRGLRTRMASAAAAAASPAPPPVRTQTVPAAISFAKPEVPPTTVPAESHREGSLSPIAVTLADATVIEEVKQAIIGSRQNLLIPNQIPFPAQRQESVPNFEAVGYSKKEQAAIVEPRYPSRRPSISREQLQSSLSNLTSSMAPPLVAIINRGSGRGDLTASRPKLSPVITPMIDVLVTPVGSPPRSPKSNPIQRLPSKETLQAPAKTPGKPVLGASRRSLLITPHGKKDAKSDITASLMPHVSFGVAPEPHRQSDMLVRDVSASTEKKTSDENANFFTNRGYLDRNNEEKYPNYAMLNSRQSLSNTISRVALLLSPPKDDGSSSIYRGTRRSRPSFIPRVVSEPN